MKNSMDKEAKKITELGGQPTAREDDFQIIYANVCRGSYSPFDLSITFSTMVEINPGTPVVMEKVQVTMSPGFAKSMLSLLKNTVDKYETQFGSVNIVPGTDEIVSIEAKPAISKKK